MTITTRAMVSISSNSTSSTEARMVTVRSVSTVSSTAAGRELRSWGIKSFTRSTTAMMLAPGWRWMLRMTAGTCAVSFTRREGMALSVGWPVPIQAARRAFSTSSLTVAISAMVTGAPFL